MKIGSLIDELKKIQQQCGDDIDVNIGMESGWGEVLIGGVNGVGTDGIIEEDDGVVYIKGVEQKRLD